jgi:hypothetical protein
MSDCSSSYAAAQPASLSAPERRNLNDDSYVHFDAHRLACTFALYRLPLGLQRLRDRPIIQIVDKPVRINRW